MRYPKKLFYLLNPALDRVLGTKKLVDEAVATTLHKEELARLLYVDPFNTNVSLDATVTITFPDVLSTRPIFAIPDARSLM